MIGSGRGGEEVPVCSVCMYGRNQAVEGGGATVSPMSGLEAGESPKVPRTTDIGAYSTYYVVSEFPRCFPSVSSAAGTLASGFFAGGDRHAGQTRQSSTRQRATRRQSTECIRKTLAEIRPKGSSNASRVESSDNSNSNTIERRRRRDY